MPAPITNPQRFPALAICLSLTLLLPTASPQTDPAQASANFDALDLPNKAAISLDRVQRDDVGQGIVDATGYLELAAHAGPSRAIPVLEAFFDRHHDPDVRLETASILVSIGDTDPKYWDLVLKQAQETLTLDPPDPFPVEGSQQTEWCASPEFRAWVEKRQLTAEKACELATVGLADKFRPLVETGDPRVIPVLHQALNARNILVRQLAIRGLVLARDPDVVPLTLDQIRRADAFHARSFAETLIESDDPRADAVVHQYLPDVNLPEDRKFRTDNPQWRRPLLTRR